ncbi:MAG: endospore germination permease [Eubacteriales bacterium]
MAEKGKINAKKLIFLTFVSRVVVTITYWPALNSPPSNQDLWISNIFSIVIQLILSIPVYFLYKKFPNQSIIEYSQTIFGKVVGKAIGFLIVLFFIHMVVLTLGQFNLFITTAVMPDTPTLFFTISMLIFCAYAVSKGIQVLGRISEIVAVLVMISITSLALLLLKDMDIKELTPVMEKGILPVLSGGFTIATRSIEVLAMAMILPKLDNPKKAKGVFIKGNLVTLLFWTVMTVTIIAVLGIDEAQSRTFPYFSIVRIATMGNFMERIDAIHMGIWVLGVFIKIFFFYYLAVLGLGQLFNMKDYKPLIIPLGALIVPLVALMAANAVELSNFTSYKILTWYSLLYMFIIPLILLVIGLIRKKGVIKK